MIFAPILHERLEVLVDPWSRDSVLGMNCEDHAGIEFQLAIHDGFAHPFRAMATLPVSCPEIIVEGDDVGNAMQSHIGDELVLCAHDIIRAIIEPDPCDVSGHPLIVEEQLT